MENTTEQLYDLQLAFKSKPLCRDTGRVASRYDKIGCSWLAGLRHHTCGPWTLYCVMYVSPHSRPGASLCICWAIVREIHYYV